MSQGSFGQDSEKRKFHDINEYPTNEGDYMPHSQEIEFFKIASLVFYTKL